MGRAIFADVTGTALGSLKQAFDDFFHNTLLPGIQDFGKSIYTEITGAFKKSADDFGPDFVGPVEQQSQGLGKGMGLLIGGGLVAAAIPLVSSFIGWIKNAMDPNKGLEDWAALEQQALNIAQAAGFSQGLVQTSTSTGTAIVSTGGYQVKSFDVGGPTGDGGLAIVHPNEYVVPQNGALVLQSSGSSSSDDRAQIVPLLQQILDQLKNGSQIIMDGKKVAQVVTKQQYGLTRNAGMVTTGSR